MAEQRKINGSIRTRDGDVFKDDADPDELQEVLTQVEVTRLLERGVLEGPWKGKAKPSDKPAQIVSGDKLVPKQVRRRRTEGEQIREGLTPRQREASERKGEDKTAEKAAAAASGEKPWEKSGEEKATAKK